MERYPTGFGRFLSAAEYALATPKEVVLVGDPDAPEMRALLGVVFGPFRPNQVVLLRDPDAGAEAIDSPLLEGRDQINGQATAYVCENYACKLPVTTPEGLGEELGVRG
jgi:uncharacterized protein YyaL (SSP411 family)